MTSRNITERLNKDSVPFRHIESTNVADEHTVFIKPELLPKSRPVRSIWRKKISIEAIPKHNRRMPGETGRLMLLTASLGAVNNPAGARREPGAAPNECVRGTLSLP
jgi:hypothetical protein